MWLCECFERKMKKNRTEAEWGKIQRPLKKTVDCLNACSLYSNRLLIAIIAQKFSDTKEENKKKMKENIKKNMRKYTSDEENVNERILSNRLHCSSHSHYNKAIV